MPKLILYWILAGLFTLNLARAGTDTNDIVIIVGKNRALDSVTSAELQKIFRAEKRKGSDGLRYVIVMRETGAEERARILSQLYGMGEDDYAKYFLQAAFAGLVQAAPKELSSGGAMRQFVAGTPGAIGYLNVSELDDSVKPLKIDGKAAGDPDYKLKAK